MARRGRPTREQRSVETTGRTIDDAVAKATAELKVSEHDLEIRVLDEGSKGFLGIGSKEARIRATVKGDRGEQRGDGDRGGRVDRGSRPPRESGRGPRRDEGLPQEVRQEAGRIEARPDLRDGSDDDARRRRNRRGRRGRGGEDGSPRVESREPREHRESREQREPRQPRQPRESRGHREPRSGDRPPFDRGGRGRRDELAGPVVVAPPDPDFEARAKDLLSGILERMGFDSTVESTYDEGAYLLTIRGGEHEETLIGRKGETLDALQHVVFKSVSHGRDDTLTVRIDVAGYRERREEVLAEEARAMAQAVLSGGRSQQTEPLRPAERRIVHRAIAEMTGVSSRAIGNGIVKRILIEVAGAEVASDSRPSERTEDRRSRSSAPVTTGEVLDYVTKATPLEIQNNNSETSGQEWGRKARPSKKIRRR